MKQGWEIKAFDDCIESVKVKTKLPSSSYQKEGAFPIVSQEKELISGYWDEYDDVVIHTTPITIFGDHTMVVKYVDFDFVVGADGVKILLPKPFLNPKFFYYWVKSIEIPSRGYARHYRYLREQEMMFPSLAEQERIVEVLDCLSGVIEKKREQLKQLDALAQSIFYQMFGDPITNEKGWGIDRLGNMCEISSSKRIYAHEYCEDGIPFYRGKEITEKSKGNDISVELYIAEDRYNELKRKFGVPQIGDILITAVGTIGNIWVVDSDSPFYFKDGNVLWLQIKDNINPIYFKTLLYNLIDKYKESMVNGCAYSALTIVNLKEMQTNKIPFALQQEFADKIEAIEKQKERIKESIKETETLFNARMDYFFN